MTHKTQCLPSFVKVIDRAGPDQQKLCDWGDITHVTHYTLHSLQVNTIYWHYGRVCWPLPPSQIRVDTSHIPRAVQYSTVQYSTGKYSTVQYSTVQYSTVQVPPLTFPSSGYLCRALWHCSTVQHGGDVSCSLREERSTLRTCLRGFEALKIFVF